MANIQHASIPEAYLHEPKGVSLATEGQVYVADGLGSGDWRYIPHTSIYYDNIGTGTTYTAPTAYTLINPTTIVDADPKGFSTNSAGRITYTGTDSIDGTFIANITFKHSSSSGVDVLFRFYKNGLPVNGAQHATRGDSGNYSHISLVAHFAIATSDYIEVYVKSASGDVIIHTITLMGQGNI